jgi:acetyl-CoA/propionyl-CoA carboxylase biotin carboxyl carrier protein
MDDALSPREVAERLGVTTRTVQRWIRQGRLPARRVGARVRVSRSALETVSREAHGGQPVGALLIANRGEIAARVARTARRIGVRVIGVHLAGERPPDADATRPIGSYLDGAELVHAALQCGADAVHPGYGFLAESADLARAVIEAGLTWVGPPPEAIAAVGDKSAARRSVAAVGVPVVPGYDGDATDDATLLDEAGRIGLPLLVKPSAGGGGKGMRVVRDLAGLPAALDAARREALGAFGDDRLILERLIEGARHVEVQVLFDTGGAGVPLGERDCSAQRRNQKVVEEAPAPSVTPEMRARLFAAALDASRAVGYVNAGTVEFLIADDGSHWFLEMNARLQVEHPVTEAITGRDLVADQLRIAAGEPLSAMGLSESPPIDGHAIEARLYAEDPESGFLPATGRLTRARWPERVRVDAGVAVGDEVTDRYDPLLAKLVAHGRSRGEALARLQTALDETSVLGVRTNLRFLRWLLAQPMMAEGEVRTDSLAGQIGFGPLALPDEAWSAAARALADEAAGGGPWAGSWRLNAAPRVRLRSGSEERTVDAAAHDALTIAIDGGAAHVDVEGQSIDFSLAPPPSVDAAVRHAAGVGGEAAFDVVAPMPGKVIAVRVAAGDLVHAHEAIVIIEAMKMEHAVIAPADGTLTSLEVSVGQQVERGDLIGVVLPTDTAIGQPAP